jgi:hypothetical protein
LDEEKPTKPLEREKPVEDPSNPFKESKQPTKQPAEQQITETLADETEKLVEKLAEKLVEKPAEKPVAKTIETSMEKPIAQPGWATPTRKDREQGMNRSSSTSSTVYTTPPETKDGHQAEEPVSLKTVQPECGGEVAPKAEKQSSLLCAGDGSVHPFARQKALVRQQKLAAKNQKKKEKKTRQASKGVPELKQKPEEKSDAETTEDQSRDVRNPLKTETEESKKRPPSPKHASRAGSDTTEGTQTTPFPTLKQGQLGSATAVQSANVSIAKDPGNKDEVSGAQKKPQEPSRADTEDGEGRLMKSEKLKKELETRSQEEPSPQVTVEQKENVDEASKVADKVSFAGDESKPAAKKPRKKKKKKNKKGGSSASQPSTEKPIAQVTPPTEPCPPFLERAPLRPVDIKGPFKSLPLCDQAMVRRGQYIVPEEAYPQSQQANSTGFPKRNLMVRESGTVTSHVLKRMPGQEEQEMASYHYRIADPKRAYRDGEMVLCCGQTPPATDQFAARHAGMDTPPPGVPPNTPADPNEMYDKYDNSYAQLIECLKGANPMIRFRNAEKPAGDAPDPEGLDGTSRRGDLDHLQETYSKRAATPAKPASDTTATEVDSKTETEAGDREPDRKDPAATERETNTPLAKDPICSACFAPYAGIRRWMFCRHCAASCRAGCRYSRGADPHWSISDDSAFVAGTACVRCKRPRGPTAAAAAPAGDGVRGGEGEAEVVRGG